MANDSPAVILYDNLGNPIGVSFDGSVYRLAVDGQVQGIDPDNTAVTGNPVLIGGQDGTNVQSLATDGYGALVTVFRSPQSIQITNSSGTPLGTETSPLFSIPNSYFSTGFGEARTVSPYTLIDLVNKYEIDARQYGTQTATGGTVAHIANESAIRLTVTGTSGSSAKLRTNTFFRYQAGKELVVKQTIYHNDLGQTNQVRRWGFFDDNDGLFWELSGTAFRAVRRTSTSGAPVDNVVAQSSWNGDKFNGTGTSGITLDLTKGNIYEIHIDWLGVGEARFFINGYLVHTFRNPNTIVGPYIKTAQLPLSCEISNTSTSTTSNFTFICASILVQGGSEPEGTSFAAFNSTVKTATVTETPILSIRPKATYNSITNRAVLFPFRAAISTEGSRIAYRIIMNATLTGAAFTSVDAASTAEFDVTATAFTGGQTLLIGFLGGTNDANNNIDLSEFFKEQGRKLRQDAFATTVDTLTIVANDEAAGSTSVKSSISWKEIR